MKSVVVYLCHYTSDAIMDSAATLSSARNINRDVYVLYDATNSIPPNFGAQGLGIYSFSRESLSKLQFPMIFDGMLAHNAHFPLFEFFYQFGHYQHYWLVEYDVAYTGNWDAFFSEMSHYEADFITCHIKQYAEEPRYELWSTISHHKNTIDRPDLLRSFNPIFRISNRALEYLGGLFRSGWKGQNEITFPTLLYHGGFTIMDMGGKGRFVPQELRGRHYSSRQSKDGSLTFCGSMRYRPPRKKPGFRSNYLYHPVKPDDPRSEWFNYKHGIVRYFIEYMIGSRIRSVIR